MPLSSAASKAARALRFLQSDGWTWSARSIDRRSGEREVGELLFEHTERAARRFILKCYSDETGSVSERSMHHVRGLLETAREHRIAVPKVHLYDAADRILVQEYATGRPCADIPTGGDFLRAMKLAGQALAALHSLPAEEGVAGRVKRIDDHIADIVRPHPMQLAERLPAHRSLIEDRLSQIRAVDRDWGGCFRPALLHRDFHLRQLIVETNRVWLLDWDHFALGDPAFDVAYFVVYLKNHLVPGHAAVAIDSFLDGYGRSDAGALLVRAPLYEAFNYLRRACRRFRLRDAGWESEMCRMLRMLEHTAL